jgi:hypothetical protein
MARLRAHFNGKVLVPIGHVDLPTDRILEVDVRDAGLPTRGSPELVLRALLQAPHVPTEDVDDLERAIGAGRLPVRFDNVFSS